MEEEEECDWRIIPRCIIPQLSLFIQLDKQIILPSLFIPIIIRHRASQQKNTDNHQFKIIRLQTVDFHNLEKRFLLSDSELPLCNILFLLWKVNASILISGDVVLRRLVLIRFSLKLNKN